MTRALTLPMAASMLLAGAGCVDLRDPCASTSCPDDRVCIAPAGGPRCVCADPAVEIDGECVVDGGEGEGED